MLKLSPSLRRRLILAGVLLAIAAAVVLALALQNRVRQQRIAACHQKRTAITTFRRESFDAPLEKMRQMRLNPEQAATLRRVDPAAYAQYAQAFGDQVERVAQAADRLGALVDAYRAADCLQLEAALPGT